MRALRIKKFGPVSEHTIEDVPCPRPGPDEVLIEVHAAGINPSDVKNAQGAFPQTTLPRTPGRDFAGVVVEGPENLLGREVYGTGGDVGLKRDGSHAEFLAIPKQAAVVKPSTLSFEEAAAVGVPYVTAWSAIVDGADIHAGETLAIIGMGAVGTAARQIARWKNVQVIAIGRNTASKPHLHEAGVEVVDSESPDLPAKIRDLTGGKGADVVLNTVGGPLFELGNEILGLRGRHAVIASAGERRVTFDLINFYHRQLRLIGIDTAGFNAVECAWILELLVPGFESGALVKPVVGETFSLDDALQAYGVVERGAPKKVVLLPRAAQP